MINKINKNSFNQFLDMDWSKIPQIFFLISIFIISRIPLLNIGFGTDPDAWRIANSAYDLKNFLIYHPSRFPGYPLPEYVNSIIINYGWVATNTLTLILSLISVIVFAKILNELKIKNKGLIVITYAFLPIIWVNSATTMDYMWALTFIIICWYFILKKKYIIAGLMMGLAIASRPTSIFLMIPFLYLIYQENHYPQKILKFSFSVLTTSILSFLPLYLIYGIDFVTFYPFNMPLMAVWADASYFFGSIAIIFGVILIICNTKVIYHKIIKEKNKMFIFLFLSIFFIIIPFINAPYEVAYLIPAIPFGLLLTNGIAKKKFFIVFCILLLLNSFVGLNITSSNNFIQDGLIKKERDASNNVVSHLKKIIDSDINNSVVISGEYLPFIAYLSETSGKPFKTINMVGYGNLESNEYFIGKKNIRYVYLASLDEIRNFQKEGYTIYYIGNTTYKMTKTMFRYDLDNYNCSNIFDHI
jgi:hypothetical protein